MLVDFGTGNWNLAYGKLARFGIRITLLLAILPDILDAYIKLRSSFFFDILKEHLYM